jgi:cysteine desulfurase
MSKIIYLDNNATTQIDPQVLKEMLPFLKEKYGNPSSIHNFGGEIKTEIEKARAKIASFLGSENSYEVVFTGTGTESDNLAILSTLAYYKDKKEIITSKVEHPAVIDLCKSLEKKGYQVTYLPVDKLGNLNLNLLKEAVTEETAIVSIMYANNETGVIFPVKEIGSFLKEKGIPFHIDAVQAAGKIPINVKDLNCDLLSISGHKIHAPKGIGALYVKKGTRLRPIFHGGHQERGRRPGTENVPGIIALGKAAELAEKHLKNTQEIKRLRDKLEKNILKNFKNSHLNGDPLNRVPNTTNIGFEYIEGEAILLYLNEKNIAASSGSACSSGSLEPSHVLRAMGVPFTSAHGSIRFSLSRFTTEKEIDYLLEILPEIINRLLKISPYWNFEKGKPKPINMS